MDTWGGGSQLIREKVAYDLNNGWVQNDLDLMIYVDRLVGNRIGKAFICQVGGCACRYHMNYTRGVIEREEMRGRLSELQIDR